MRAKTIVEDKGLVEPLKRLSRDIKLASNLLSKDEIRFLVSTYYQMQEQRKRSDNQIRALEETPHDVLTWLSANTSMLERSIKNVLDVWTDSDPTSAWAKSIYGIGPILSAGLSAHIDIQMAPTVGHIWSFAGLVNGQEWARGQKRPWNAELKTLCWKISESFQKCPSEKSSYRQLYEERKLYEQSRNDALLYKEQAENVLKTKKIGKDTTAFAYYTKGQLPPGHINARVKRYVTKLFLAHWHEVAYKQFYLKPPPKPYVFEYKPDGKEHVHRLYAEEMY